MSERVLDPEAPRRLLAQSGVARVMAALAMAGEETRLVGGCVRDALLGRAVNDIDLATTLRPDRVIARAKAAGLRSIPTGIEHGTVTLLADGHAFEVTTLREDIETDGRHAVVRFGRSFERDAQRRDFTINALAVAVDGTLHDTTGGMADLATGRVRFIGEAGTRIREDALRILRFFRFHARYGLDAPDPAGLRACIAARDALDGLSRERIRDEFLKLLAAPGAVAAIGILSDGGLLTRLIGGLGDVGRLQRVLQAGAMFNAGESPRPYAQEIGCLAALTVFSIDDAERLRVRLRLARAECALLVAYARVLAALQAMPQIDADDVRRLTAIHGFPAVGLGLDAVRGEPRPSVTDDARSLLIEIRNGSVSMPRFPLTGADLVARGVLPGPEVGRRLALAKSLWLKLGCPEGEAARTDLLDRATA